MKKIGNPRSYRICKNCVMDTSDAYIQFDQNGKCDHCRDFEKYVLPNWHPDENGCQELLKQVEQIKEWGKGKEYDCLLGLSGGVDSSYMLHLMVREYGLRPLVFHVDGGWNTEISVHNINVLIEKLGLDLFTEVINWEEMKDFQLAFFKSGVPHIDIPQDHAFIATLYQYADRYKMKYILNGGNISTECVQYPMFWLYYGTDMAQIDDIRRRFGTIPMKTYPFSSIFRHKIYLRYIKKIKVIKPLNNLPYRKAAAVSLLEREYNWKSYPQKHFESRFTKFYEGYWLPERFGFDTRRVQFSSLILTGQMGREEALRKLESPSCDPNTIKEEFEYIATKLGISSADLKTYLHLPKKYYWDYNNRSGIFKTGAKILSFIGSEKTVKRAR